LLELSIMPCSNCGEWTEQWIVWRLLESEVIPEGMFAYEYGCVEYGDRRWFFFCQACKDRWPELRKCYVNFEGGLSDDSESSSEAPRAKQRRIGAAAAAAA